ncbi:Ig-like domain-containing domain [Pedobacter boryungensis]|uniref:Ig-like domain-containing protein n=1 Tax=Pedobacter boryungensis TaxID=869962 RepID=A0ABX2DBP4_9SPHI|nr:Ig-like domain-containing domain [Pedobacter boryungensis]NQX31498.1 Ig-like domain-containing protein [Pedobacter boryungensis]
MSKIEKLTNRPYLHYYLILIIALIYGCASIRTPEGGPKDTKPPKVLKMDPKNITTNFKSKKITIEFDEYIKLQNEFKEFSISPEQERPPILKGSNTKKLEITLQDSLEKNTTYTLNFGKSIADITEGNALKNFTYVFATGPTLDSLSISGNVKNALTGQPEIETIVFILPLSRDSLFGKKKPSIYTTTDSSGNYKLNNLKKDTYKIYALHEKGGDKIYQQNSDEVGFVKAPLVLDRNLDSVNLMVFKELASEFRILDRKLNTDGSISMNFNQQLRKPEIAVIEPIAVDANKKVRFNKTNDSVKIWLNDLSFDSVKIAIKDEGKSLDTVKFTRGKKDTYTRNIQAGDNLEGNLLNPYKDLKLHFNFPIDKIDLTKVTLLEDSILRTGLTLIKDSLDFLTYNVKYTWKPKEEYILKLADGALTGIFNSKNKDITKTFKLGNDDDYGTLILSVEVPDTSKNYILQIVNEKKEVVISSERIYKNTTVTFNKYRAGIYFARIIYDENKNGIWDTGNVKQGFQPEKIWYAPLELSIKANWDRKEKLIIP